MTEALNKPIDLVEMSRIVLLGLMSLLFATSGLLLFLAPLPLIFIGLKWGRMKISIVSAVILITSFYFVKENEMSLAIIGIQSFFLIMPFLVIQIMSKRIAPFKGILVSGLFLSSFLSVVMLTFFSMRGESPSEFLLSKVKSSEKELVAQAKMTMEKDSLEQKDFIHKIEKEPELFVEEIFPFIPKMMIISSFVFSWVYLCFGYKLSLVRLQMRKDFKKLIHMKVPDHFVWGAIIGLGLILFESHVGSTAAEIGSYIITFLGAFYFFQGAGIYISLLDNVKVVGFFRTLLIVSTVCLAWKMLVLIGFTDLFVNYRRFFKKNNTEGEL